MNLDFSGKHVMLDFETLGNKPSTTVLSLGAVLFDQNGIIDKREWFFDAQEQINRGRSVDYSTIAWWSQQSDQARQIFRAIEKHTLQGFVNDFKQFYSSSRAKPWGNGADFDLPIFTDLWTRHCGQSETPWKFWEGRCFRTVAALTKCKDFVPREGVHHRAVDDAEHQTKCLLALIEKLT